MKSTIKTYLQFLEAGDYPSIMELFTGDSTVNSPLYGEKRASEFFRELLEDTDHSVITPMRVYFNDTERSGAAYFLYEWILDNGQHASFPVVDIFDFDEHGKIKALTIIYDTALTRSAFDAQRQG